jgi:hypothetical protein
MQKTFDKDKNPNLTCFFYAQNTTNFNFCKIKNHKFDFILLLPRICKKLNFWQG